MANPPPRTTPGFPGSRLLGEGGMGRVVAVRDERLDREVAAKFVAADDPTGLGEHLVREARLTARLDHPFIVPVYELVTDGPNGPCFMMKRVEGQCVDLASVEVRAKQPTWAWHEWMVDVMSRICEAVGFAHARGVVHRDLTPRNLMVGSFGQVYVMDWGAATELGETTARIMGTPGWIAPEVASGLPATPRSDVFGLGATLHALLAGVPPIVRDPSEPRTLTDAAGMAPPVVQVTLGPDVPPGLARIVATAVAEDPAHRYPDAEALERALIQFRRGGGSFATRTWAAGETIVAEGDVGKHALILVRGRCEVRKGDVVVRSIGPGDVFGETALLTHGVRTASVVALDAVEAKVITHEALERELDRTEWLGTFVRALAGRFVELEAEG